MKKLGNLFQEADWKSEKHVPVIDCPDSVKSGETFEIRVSIGKEVAHPNTTDHHIRWIQVFFQPEDVPNLEFEHSSAAQHTVLLQNQIGIQSHSHQHFPMDGHQRRKTSPGIKIEVLRQARGPHHQFVDPGAVQTDQVLESRMRLSDLDPGNRQFRFFDILPSKKVLVQFHVMDQIGQQLGHQDRLPRVTG